MDHTCTIEDVQPNEEVPEWGLKKPSRFYYTYFILIKFIKNVTDRNNYPP